MGKINNILDSTRRTIAVETKKGLKSMDPENISNNFGSILTLLFLLMAFVELRYECEEKLTEISRLKRELNDVRYTSIERWGDLTTLNNRVNIRKTIIKNNINLIESDEPAVKLK